MPGIFISYRREDSGPHAGRLYDHLANRFGKQNVFMDVDNIEPGLDFVDVLQRTVGSCNVMVAVIGRNWLSAAHEQGRRRLDNPDDLVRVEIATALNRGIRVIPVLVAGAPMPRSQDLPEALAPFSRRNALEISDATFHMGVGPLVTALEKTLGTTWESGGTSHGGKGETRFGGAESPKPPFISRLMQALAEFLGSGPRRRPYAPASASAQRPLPFADLPWWRRGFLLYRPGGALGWPLRFLFWWLCVTAVSLAAVSNPHEDNSSVVGVLIVIAAIIWYVASWFDKRAARNRAVRNN